MSSLQNKRYKVILIQISNVFLLKFFFGWGKTIDFIFYVLIYFYCKSYISILQLMLCLGSDIFIIGMVFQIINISRKWRSINLIKCTDIVYLAQIYANFITFFISSFHFHFCHHFFALFMLCIIKYILSDLFHLFNFIN